MATEDKKTPLIRKTRERSHIYSLLSQLYREEPDLELLKKLKDPALLSVLAGLGLKIGAYLDSKPLKKLVEELAVEYTYLFLGPGKHVYPYESAYTPGGGQHSLKASAEIKRIIQSTGLDYHPDFTSQPDHISVELEFMARLTQGEAEAREKGLSKKTKEFLQFEGKFLKEHLSSWTEEFLDQITKTARLLFYPEVAKLTSGYLTFEAEELKTYFH